MAISPQSGSDGPLKLSITSNGSVIADQYRVISLTVSKAVNRLPAARIVLEDGDMPNNDFPASDAAVFEPGAKIAIEAGYGADTAPVFAGIVVKHGIRIGAGGQAELWVECRHPAFRLTLGRSNANHVARTDSDVIAALLNACAGIGSVAVDSTTTTYDGLVQFYSSDWDFVLTRAEANGLLVIAGDDGVTVKAPATAAGAVLTLTYGIDLMGFQADIDARVAFGEVAGVAWDPSTQEVSEQQATAVALASQGNLDPAALAAVGGLASLRLQTPTPVPSGALQVWAKARQTRAALARLRGSMRFQGSALAMPGSMVEVKGVGKRFSGNLFVSAVEHTIEDNNWITEVEFGLAPETFAERQGAQGPDLGGLGGLHIGVVTKLDADPGGQHRIQVSLPVLQDKNEGIWARLASAYGSDAVGAFFVPEIGDEVVVAHLNNDPSYPVVIASLYSSKRNPPYSLTADNFIKAIVTKGKLKMEFDDEKKVMTLLTPAGNTFVISDDAKSITLEDQHNNKVVLDADGILLDSPADIVLKAGGNIKMTAGANLEAKAGADIKQEALNITCQASTAMVAKGAASAELSAAGQVTVKGAMVMIN